MTNTRGKHRFDISLELDAPINTCYEVSYLENHMMHWVPTPKSVVYDHSGAAEPYGVGSNRLITQQKGNTLREHIVETHRPTRVAYAIYTFPKPFDWLIHNYQGHISFEPIGESRTRLTWSIHYDCHLAGQLIEPLLRMAFKKLITTLATNIQKYVPSL